MLNYKRLILSHIRYIKKKNRDVNSNLIQYGILFI